jgi:hypothetical protein
MITLTCGIAATGGAGEEDPFDRILLTDVSSWASACAFGDIEIYRGVDGPELRETRDRLAEHRVGSEK